MTFAMDSQVQQEEDEEGNEEEKRSVHKKEEQHMLSVDEIIETYVGGFGRAQFFQVVVVALAWAFDAQHTFITIFTDAQPSWRCSRSSEVHPKEIHNCTTELSICKMDQKMWEWERGKEASIVSEWNLICANKIQAGIPTLCFFVGAQLGYIMLGPLADSWLGRKRMLMLSSVIFSFTGFLTAVSPNFWIYALLRTLSGFGKAPVATCCPVLSTELVGRKWRGMVGFFLFLFATIGFLSLPGLAYLTRYHFSWRKTYVYISILPLAYTIFLLPLVWESPRWLFLRGKSEDALQSLRRMAKLNGRLLPENLGIHENSTESQTGSALSRLWATKWARKRLMLTMAVGFGMGILYFGMPLGVGNLDFNLYLSVTFNALSEIPAAIVSTVLVSKTGRRGSIFLFTLLSGMFCFACVFLFEYRTHKPDSTDKRKLSKSKNWAELVGELGAFLSSVTAFNVLLIYCLEMFPTSVRNSAMSMLRQAINVGAIISPVIAVIGRDAPSVSFVVFGVAIIISGLFVLGLPETKDRPLCETLEDQERREIECNR